MLPAIVGFEVQPTAIRGTRKFNQHTRADDLAATIAGQAEAGRDDIVEAIATWLEKIKAPALAILFEDDELNPIELGTIEVAGRDMRA